MIQGTLWDGWSVALTAGEDFETPVSLVLDYDEEPTGDEDYYELPIPIEVEVTDARAVYANPMPLQYEQQGWAALVVALKALCRALGGHADAFQSNHYNGAALERADFWFRFIPGDKTWKGGRL